MPASVVLPSPGGPANSRWSTVWFALAGRLEHDREVFLELALADELVERPRSQTGFDARVRRRVAPIVGGDVGRRSDVRIEELVTHGAPPAT